MRLAIVDNRDSFTFNLVDYVERAGIETLTYRNTVSVDQLLSCGARGVLLSPGPGRPEEAGHLLAIVEAFAGKIPMLGVCLGLQAMVVQLGGKLGYLDLPVQGYASVISHDGQAEFEGLEKSIRVGRYHALHAVDVPGALSVSARTSDGIVMAVRSTSLQMPGFQFHPESILSAGVGEQLLKNWIRLVEKAQ